MWPANSVINPAQNSASLVCRIPGNICREADNVADPTTVAWAASRRGTALESTAEVLHARAGVLATQGRRMRVAVLGAAVLGPVLACTLTCLLYFVLSTFEVGPHETLR